MEREKEALARNKKQISRKSQSHARENDLRRHPGFAMILYVMAAKLP
jgi:hypothetical protein